MVEDLDMSRCYDDETLIYHCLSGDEKAFTFLVHKYKDLVHAYACQKVRNYSDAEDITQETFIRAYRNLEKLRHPHNFRSWLYTIASNECNRHLSKARQKVSLEDVNEETLKLETHLSRTPTDWQIDLEEAMESLPKDNRIAISMFYMSDCSIREISEYLGVSINTVKSKLRRTRQKLGNMLESYGKALSKNRLKGGFIMQVMEQLHHIPQPTIPPAWRGILTRQAPLAIATSLCVLLGILGFLLGDAQETRLMPLEAVKVVWLTPPVGNSGIFLLAANTSSEDDTQKTDQILDNASSLLADKKYAQGVSLYKSGHTDEAIHALMRVSRKDKEWLTAQLILGRSYFRKAICSMVDADTKKFYETALDKLSLALDANSSNSQRQQATYLYALCQIKLGMTDKKESAEQLQAAQQDEDPEVRFVAAELLGMPFPGMRVVGTVTQSESGQPIPGVSIYIQRLGRDTTDAMGQFSIGNIRGHKGTTRLWVDVEGYGRKLVQIVISHTEPETRVDVEMRPGATVTGRIVDSEGEPIPDAKVNIVADSHTMRTARTDHTGAYKLKGIEPRQAEQRLWVEHSDFISTTSTAAINQAGVVNVPDIVMERGVMLRGSVVDERGNPVHDAFVTAKRSRAESGHEGQDRTDENGQFCLRNLKGDSATVIVDSPQFSPAYSRVTLDPNERRNVANFILRVGKVLTGAVMDEEGNPIGGAKLRLQTWDAVKYKDFDHHAITDVGGKFRMEHLPDGKITLRLDKSGYVYMNFYPATVEADQPVTIMQSPIVMKKPTRIYAKVLDAETGMPVKNFVVKIDFSRELRPTDINPGGLSSAWVQGYAFQSDAGEFETYNDARGKVIALQVEAKGYAPAYIPRVVFGEYDEEPLLIRLSRGKQLVGTVMDAESGKPVSGAFISIFDKNHPLYIYGSQDREGSMKPVVSDEIGRFTLPGALTEEFYLYVTHPERAASIAGPLHDSETQDIRVEMQKGCTITGTAEPLRRMALGMSTGLPMMIRLVTHASQDGIYRFDKVIPGKYSLSEMIEGEDFAASGRSKTVELKSGQTEEINFRIEDKSSFVYGKVTEADGTPVKNIAVRAQFHASEELRAYLMQLPKEELQKKLLEYSLKYQFRSGTAITDRDGNFKIFGLPPGDYEITARKRVDLNEIEFREYVQKHGKVPQPQLAELIFTIKDEPKQTEVTIVFSQSDSL